MRSILFVLVMLLTASAEAQVTRFASIFGNDGNPCTREQPCRTVQRAVDLAPAGGEVQILDSGEYQGAVSIIKAMVVFADGVSATLTGNGIVINAPGASVVLRGLTIHGDGETAIRGVHVIAAASVQVENCVVEQFEEVGIESLSAPELVINDTILRNNKRHGMRAANARVFRAQILGNGSPINNGSGGTLEQSEVIESTVSGNEIGLDALSGSVTVNEVEFSSNDAGVVVRIGASLSLSNSRIVQSSTGLEVNWLDPFTEFGIAVVSGSVISGNQLGVTGNSESFYPTRVYSRGNNVIEGNDVDVSGEPLVIIGTN